MNKIPIFISWLLTHFLVCIIHYKCLRLIDNLWPTLCCIILFILIHRSIALHFIEVYMDMGSREE